MGKVLVLDANQRSALAIIRSLGTHGLQVIAGSHDASSLGGASRYATASVCYSDPAVSANRFLDDVMNIVDRLAIDTVIPATDLTTMLLLSQSNPSTGARIVAPPAAAYEALTDKARLIELAAKLGITIPETLNAKSSSDIADAIHKFGFPVVLKPSRSRYLKDGQILETNVEVIRDEKLLSERLRQISWVSDIPCLVQRYVNGHGAGVFALFGPSGPIAWFAHKRLREKPRAGGVSVLSESVAVDPAVQTAAARILSAVGWLGVAMVEFRISDDGTPYLMEVNGRFWGSLQLSIDCGVDFPWLLYQLTQGSNVSTPPPYIIGRRLRWLLGDLDSLLIELRDNSVSVREKASAVSTFLLSFGDPRCRQEVLRLHDPRPGFTELNQWLQAMVK